MYLPVFRDGGLLVLGDVHAVQGDGEVYGEGAECAADVTVTVDVDRCLRGPRPVVETPDSLICLAGRGNFFGSLSLAVADMTALLARLYGVEEQQAYVLCTTIGSMRIAGTYPRRELCENRVLVGISVPKNLR